MNLGQVTKTTPELAPLLNPPHQREDFEFDRFNPTGLQEHQVSKLRHTGYKFVTITSRLLWSLHLRVMNEAFGIFIKLLFLYLSLTAAVLKVGLVDPRGSSTLF
ncbi:hypothetical protein TNCV_2741731 [Trichonephila clavipes]|nr:hypothetical protein TNCV_2741731 [Trichonephila clavipes]